MATQSPLVARVCHGALRTPDLDASLRHATEVLGLRESERQDGIVYLTAGARHHDLQLIPGERSGLHHMGLEATSRAALDEIEARARSGGHEVLARGRGIEPGVDEALRLLAPGDHVVEVHAGMAEDQPPAFESVGATPVKLGHVTVTTPDRAELEDFFTAVLGFIPSDRVGGEAVWMRCNHDHHGIAILGGGEAGLRHFAWEVGEVADLVAVADLAVGSGSLLTWGIGRHGPGNNLACYHTDPIGATHEHLFDLQQIEDRDWQGRDWEGLENWRNLWGPMNDAFSLEGDFPRAVGVGAGSR